MYVTVNVRQKKMTKKNHVFWQTDKTFDSFCSLEDQEQTMRGGQKHEINKSWKTTKLTSTTTARQEGEKIVCVKCVETAEEN